MIYEKITLVTIISYLISAVFLFVNAFIKEWFAGTAKNSKESYKFTYGLLRFCAVSKGNTTCLEYDADGGVNNQVFLELNINYYCLLVGGGSSIAAALLMLPETEDKKRTNKYKLHLGLRHASSFFSGIALGAVIWMEIRLFRLKLNQGYVASVNLTYDMHRSTGYALSWVTTCVCFISAVIGSYELRRWKKFIKNRPIASMEYNRT